MNFEDYISSPIPPKCSINEEEMFFAYPTSFMSVIALILFFAVIFFVTAIVQINQGSNWLEIVHAYLFIMLIVAIYLFGSYFFCSRVKYDAYIKLNKEGLYYYSSLSSSTEFPKEIPLNLKTNRDDEGDVTSYYQEQVIPYSNVLEIQFEESINKLCSKGISIITVVTNDDRIYIALKRLKRNQLKWLVEAGNVMLSHLKGKPLKKLEKSLSLDQMQELESEIFQNDNSNTESNK